MGDTIRFLHMSELGMWDKSPICVDPDLILAELKPSMPSGETRYGTVIIRESTGWMIGDWWNRAWEAGKDKDDEFVNVFLPWFLQEEYRITAMASEVIEYTEYEKDINSYAKSEYGIEIDKAQWAWYRHESRQGAFKGNWELWATKYPSVPEEAFMSPGATIYTAEMVKIAKATVRPHKWVGNIMGMASPQSANWVENESGECQVWEFPKDNMHYVIGADCQWGKKKEADFDNAYVQCVESGKVCCRIRGHFPLNEWGWKLAAVGFKYNTALLAPERNAMAATALMPLLLGNVGDWRYPNIYVRYNDVKMKGYRAEDYGWLTDHHSKGELIVYSQTQTMDDKFDWCDDDCVNEMRVIIRHEDNTIGSPSGMHDDCWMSRMITAYVAHQQFAYLIQKGELKSSMASLSRTQIEYQKLLEELDSEEEEFSSSPVGISNGS